MGDATRYVGHKLKGAGLYVAGFIVLLLGFVAGYYTHFLVFWLFAGATIVIWLYAHYHKDIAPHQ